MQVLQNHTQKRPTLRTRPGAQRGVSLIEVLIVLVILVVGISTVLRIFPSGFFSIESVSTAAVADSLGQALIEAQTQNSASLPDEILPGMLSAGQPTATAAMAAYDPDVPDNLDNARLIHNETLTIPTPTTIGNQRQSLYVVSYGPIVLGVDPSGTNLTTLPNYLTINSLPWQIKTGDSTNAADPPQDNVTSGQPMFLVDYTHQMIAVPYAPYATDSNGNTLSYDQKFVLKITGSDGNTYTEYLDVPAATPRDTNNPEAPFMPDKRTYLLDTKGSNAVYQGGWFDPTNGTYPDTSANAQTKVPANVSWTSVVLTRPFQGISNTAPPNTPLFSAADPYQFMLPNANFGTITPPLNSPPNSVANLGVIAFNPLGAGGNGVPPLKAQISYQTYDWQIIHEDRDIPVISSGGQFIARLTLKRLKRNGDSYTDTAPDGSLVSTQYTGLAGGAQDVRIMDLDTGQQIGGTLTDEDNSGTNISATGISVGHSVGRLVFSSNAFGDNPSPNPNGPPPKPHRVRIFYQCQGDWTAAVQKAASRYTPDQAVLTGQGKALLPGEYAFDITQKLMYFPLSDANRTIEIDGITATLANGTTKVYPSVTVAISPVLTPPINGAQYVSVDLSQTLTDPLSTSVAQPVTFSAVRGLSARAVVAWKENKRWKVHTVDTVLTRSQ